MLAVTSLGACGTDDRVDGSVDESRRTPVSTSPQHENNLEAEVDAILQDAGVSERDVELLGRASAVTGHPQGSSSEERTLAAQTVDLCQEVRAGAVSWAEVQRSELDPMVGSTPTEASQWVAYMRDQFCPKIS